MLGSMGRMTQHGNTQIAIMRELTIKTFIYYLIDSVARKGLCKIMQCKEIELWCRIEKDHFKELS